MTEIEPEKEPVQQKKIFIVGYYGYNNAGDEALLKKTICLLKERYNEPRICALYKNNKSINIHNTSFSYTTKNQPYKNSSILGEVTLCQRTSLIKIIKGLLFSDELIFGGGGLLQDSTSSKSLYYYLSYILLALLLKKKIYLIAQGIGPIKSKFSRWLIKVFLKGVHSISVRDHVTLEFLQSLGIKNAILSADLTYYNSIATESTLQSSPVVGLSIREQALHPNINSCLTNYIENLEQEIVFLDFQPEKDFHTIQKIESLKSNIKAIVSMNDYFVNQTPSIYSFSTIVAMRYHACVWASLNLIPFLALAYDIKTKILAEELQQEYIDLTNPELLTNKTCIHKAYQKIQKNHQKYKNNLQKYTPLLIKRAKLNENTLKQSEAK